LPIEAARNYQATHQAGNLDPLLGQICSKLTTAYKDRLLNQRRFRLHAASVNIEPRTVFVRFRASIGRRRITSPAVSPTGAATSAANSAAGAGFR
jgi:hypothetical protein